jgi:hypothetical protein
MRASIQLGHQIKSGRVNYDYCNAATKMERSKWREISLSLLTRGVTLCVLHVAAGRLQNAGWILLQLCQL